jgi:hypothetical protein
MVESIFQAFSALEIAVKVNTKIMKRLGYGRNPVGTINVKGYFVFVFVIPWAFLDPG